MTDIIDVDQLKKLLHEFAEKRDWEKFHNPKNLAMALAGEAGELLEIFQWMNDSESLQASQDSSVKEKTAHELADILLYLVRLAAQMNINLTQAIQDKIAINHKKYPAELVKGSSKKHSDYLKD